MQIIIIGEVGSSTSLFAREIALLLEQSKQPELQGTSFVFEAGTTIDPVELHQAKHLIITGNKGSIYKAAR